MTLLAATRNFAAFGVALVATLGLVALGAAALVNAHEPDAATKIEAEHVITVPLPGDPGKEIDINIYTFPPKSAVPWHIHEGAVGIEYGLQGTIMLERDGKPPFAIEKGKTLVVSPDVVHRGWNPSKTEPAKLYVVRIKPKGAPRATMVDKTESPSKTPAPGAYPQ